MTSFRVLIEAEVELHDTDIWPNGDVPENPTCEDVAKVMESCGSKWSVIRNWNLMDYAEVWVNSDSDSAWVWK